MRPSRARAGVARTLPIRNIEERLERILRRGGETALQRLRDEAKEISKLLGLQDEYRRFDNLAGTLLGTRHAPLESPSAIARGAGQPYDPARLDLFRLQGPDSEIRPEDAHDVLGTWRVVSDDREMSRLPRTVEELTALLKSRHAAIMEGRPDKGPGQFAPELMQGTLARGFETYRGLTSPLHRAIFMMFLISEVHPFADGNGRVARIMMNAELVAAGESRIVVPTVYRNGDGFG